MWSQLGDRLVEDLIDMPSLTAPTCLATLEVLTRMFSAVANFDANLTALVVCRAVSLRLEYGNCDASCAHYAWLGRVVGGRFGDYQAAHRFGLLACDLVDQRGLTRFQAQVYHAVSSNIIPWVHHVRDSRKFIARALDAAITTGNLIYEAYSLVNLNANMLMAGDSLAETQIAIEASLHKVRKLKFRYVADLVTMQLGYVRTLRGHTRTFASFDEQPDEEEAARRAFTGNPDLATLETLYWIRVLQARFLAGDYAAASSARSKAERRQWTHPTEVSAAEFQFYGALCLAACCPSTATLEAGHLEQIHAHHSQLRAWERNCPANFEHRSALVGAEIARIEGRVIDAMHLYEQAIRAAEANGFVHHKAIACELAGYFYSARGFEKIAQMYLRDARHCYLLWGADAKVHQLEQRYPHLAAEESAAGRASTIGASVEQLDLATVIKVSQAVSSEIVLENLIDTFMRTTMAQAGAERALLIMPCGLESRMEAEATTTGDKVTVRLVNEAVTERVLPESVLRYVLRTHEIVILDNAAAQSPFGVDSYIRRRQARSILCLPLLNQAKLIGVLYLENNSTARVFAPTRISVLKLLASQAAIALENARLYNDLQEREARIRRLVDSNIIGIFIGDSRGRIIETNDAFLDLLGYGHEDLVSGRIRWTKLTPAEWAAADQDAIAQLSETGTCKPYEKEYFRKDGNRVPVLVGGAFFEVKRDEGVVFVIDMTDRKRAEQALSESEERFRTLVQFSFDVYWESDAQHRFIRQEFAEGLADPPAPGSEIGKTRWEAPYLEPDAEAWRKHRETLDAHLPFRDFEHARPTPDGGKRYVSVSGLPVFDKTGRFIGYRGVGRHITNRKRAEAALRASEERWRCMFEIAPVGITTIDFERRTYLTANKSFQRMTGYTEVELRNLTTLEITHEDDRAAMQERIDSGTVGNLQRKRYRRRDGEVVWADVTSFVVPATDSTPAFRGAVIVDITD